MVSTKGLQKIYSVYSVYMLHQVGFTMGPAEQYTKPILQV